MSTVTPGDRECAACVRRADIQGQQSDGARRRNTVCTVPGTSTTDAELETCL